MSAKEIEWRIANLRRQVQDHLRNEERLSDFPMSVRVEQTMRACAERQIKELQEKLQS